MSYGVFIAMLLIGLDSVQSAAFTQTQQKLDDHPLAWYHLPTAQSQPPNVPLSSNQSPYGPSSSNSFVPIPSPFVFPKPKTTEQLAASQIVNAAQELVDQLRSKTNASTELIEAVKDALARFRTSVTYSNIAASPSNGGSHLESAFRNIVDGGWLERTFANWAFSDTTTADSGLPDASAAAQKMDELWHEAMLASAFSGAQHNEETQNQQSDNDQRRSKSLRPFREESGRLIERVRLNDEPIETEHKMALNCQVFRKLCTILRIIQNDNVKPSS
ncbi:hypothetical protein M3Y96_00903400 [Aphelenchoides besseyi]|nr:hypothetical protein M3Y96_00903400 [Aphelenchoides besseyi]